MIRIVSPTGLGIREQDEWGCGDFGAPRGNSMHKGTDFMLCKPGEQLEKGRPVYSPVDGKVVRKAWPYRQSSKYTGILITNDFGYFWLFYLMPFPRILKFGTPVRMMQEIGLAQDISQKEMPGKYPGMIPHIHLQIQIHPDNLNPETDKIFINPELLL